MSDDARLVEESRKLPMEERVDSASWKVRVAAYEDIQAACSRRVGRADTRERRSCAMAVLRIPGRARGVRPALAAGCPASHAASPAPRVPRRACRTCPAPLLSQRVWREC